jgi:hypothetical protein
MDYVRLDALSDVGDTVSYWIQQKERLVQFLADNPNATLLDGMDVGYEGGRRGERQLQEHAAAVGAMWSDRKTAIYNVDGLVKLHEFELRVMHRARDGSDWVRDGTDVDSLKHLSKEDGLYEPRWGIEDYFPSTSTPQFRPVKPDAAAVGADHSFAFWESLREELEEHERTSIRHIFNIAPVTHPPRHPPLAYPPAHHAPAQPPSHHPPVVQNACVCVICAAAGRPA